MIVALFVLAGVVLVAFAGVLLVGAPYLPTLRPQIYTAFELLDLKQGQTVLELGCGDGKVLIAAAEKGYRAIGIELNPFLWAIAWLRTRRYGSKVQVIWGNFWHMAWPPADAVFVFLLDRFMPKLDSVMQKRGGKLVSIAFRVPAAAVAAERNSVFLYRYQ